MAVLSGCQREHSVTGQVFVVTKGRENVKLGLVAVHVVDDEAFSKIARKALLAHAVANVKVTEAKANLTTLAALEQDLNKLKPAGGAVPILDNLMVEIEERRSELQAKAKSDVSELLFKLLPSEATKTDADGQFTVKVSGARTWLLARASRTVVGNDETYVWMQPTDGKSPKLLLANDNLLPNETAMLEVLRRIAGLTGEGILQAPRIQDSDFTSWANEARKRANAAVAERQPNWTVPVHWKQQVPGAMQAAKYAIGDGEALAEVSVVLLGGMGGALKANLNRWRNQLSLPAAAESEVEKQAPPFPALGPGARIVELTGSTGEGTPADMVVLLVPSGSGTWFYKLMGAKSVVAKEKDALVAFVKTAKH